MKFAALMLAAMSFAQAGLAFEAEKLVIALKPDKNPDAMMKERAVVEEYFRKALGCDVQVIVPLSGAVILEGLANGSIDLGYLSSTDMVHARKANAAEVLVAGEIEGQRSYQSYWLVKAEAPYQDIAGLKGKPVAFSSRTSTSGYLIPLLDLKQRELVNAPKDVETFFGGAWFGTGYVSAVERVLAGGAEAAAVSDYVFRGDKHLTPEQKSQLRVLQSQGPVPTHVLAVSNRVSAKDREELKVACLSLNTPPNTALRDSVFTSKLVEVDAEKHLAPVAEAISFASGTP
jgi:phosphonate transport system substrate-binding protein